MISSRTKIGRGDVASHYDELDHFYRGVWGNHVHHGLWRSGNETREQAVLQLVELVAREAQIGDGSRICDIGCGYGETARVLASRGAKVTGITVSPAQFSTADMLNNGATNPSFVVGDWLTNDFADEQFEAAIAIESSEHMPDKRRFFEQAHRVLRGNGRLVVCAWLAAEDPTPRAQHRLLEPICREGRMPHLGSATDYETLAQRAGFRVQRFEDITREVERTWPAIVRRLLAKMLTEPRYLQFLFSRHARNRIFALTIVRIWLAYRVNAMRYGIFTFVKR